MAKVAGLISWPNSRSGATLGGSSQPPVRPLALGLQQPQVALDEQPARAAAGVVDRHARLGVQHPGHEHGHLSGRVELPGALALPLGELPQQVLVGSAQDVGLHVVEAEAVLGVVEDLHQGAEPLVVHDPLPGGRGVEVGDVDDALEPGVLPGDGPHGVGESTRPSRWSPWPGSATAAFSGR